MFTFVKKEVKNLHSGGHQSRWKLVDYVDGKVSCERGQREERQQGNACLFPTPQRVDE